MSPIAACSLLDTTCYRLAAAESAGVPLDHPGLARAGRYLEATQHPGGSWEEDRGQEGNLPPWAQPGELAPPCTSQPTAGWGCFCPGHDPGRPLPPPSPGREWKTAHLPARALAGCRPLAAGGLVRCFGDDLVVPAGAAAPAARQQPGLAPQQPSPGGRARRARSGAVGSNPPCPPPGERRALDQRRRTRALCIHYPCGPACPGLGATPVRPGRTGSGSQLTGGALRAGRPPVAGLTAPGSPHPRAPGYPLSPLRR